jgi:hypothetical protein
MKDITKQEQKALSVISLIIVLFSTANCYTQKYDIDFISKEEYNVINSVLTNVNAYIYGITDFDKDIAIFFEDESLAQITRKVGIPVTISDNELRNILNKKIRKKIISKIYLSKPLELNSRKLNKNINLTDSYDKPKNLSNNVKRIIEPIIIDDVAIFRMIGYLESSVHILKKEEGKWLIKYTFNDWLILE